MLNSTKTWQEEVDILEMNDRGSKGCSVCLAEMMGGENMDILYNFITDIRKRDMEALIGIFTEKLENTGENFEQLIKDYYEN